MGASRILSAKKHFETVSKYSAQLCSTLPPPIQASHSHLSEIQFTATKLVFSAWWRPLGCDGLFVIGCCAVCFGCLCKRRWKFVPFSGYRMKNKFRSQDQLLYANRVRHATTPGSYHAENTSFVSTNAISEREGGGPGHWSVPFSFRTLPTSTKRL